MFVNSYSFFFVVPSRSQKEGSVRMFSCLLGNNLRFPGADLNLCACKPLVVSPGPDHIFYEGNSNLTLINCNWHRLSLI